MFQAIIRPAHELICRAVKYESTNDTFFFIVALRPNAGHGLLILEVFWITHNYAPQSVGLL
jgi:hypothetical protein